MFREFDRTTIEFDTEEKLDSLIEIFEEADLYCLDDHMFYGLTENLKTRKVEGRKRGHYAKTHITTYKIEL